MSARTKKEKETGALSRLLGGGRGIPTLSQKEALILHMLVGTGEMFGQQMVDESEGGLGRGTVYVTLNRMEDKGYVESRQEERPPGAMGLPRRLYKATGRGSAVLREWSRLATRLVLATEGTS
jgi:DNA-binding PadR family transcriptional regulator